MGDTVVDVNDPAAVTAALEARESKIAELTLALQNERSQNADERRTYQARIVELASRLGVQVTTADEERERARKRVQELEELLQDPACPQSERNALAMELARLKPLA